MLTLTLPFTNQPFVMKRQLKQASCSILFIHSQPFNKMANSTACNNTFYRHPRYAAASKEFLTNTDNESVSKIFIQNG